MSTVDRRSFLKAGGVTAGATLLGGTGLEAISVPVYGLWGARWRGAGPVRLRGRTATRPSRRPAPA